ncbi:MAG: hypothetical protein FJ395_03565 [Verrucomicrobia bacterium]|nr:hypothetical protein [Verrucomicrobiota bacterium]
MKPRPPKNFSGVPFDEDGKPINVTGDEATYAFYLDWLADYLYRPSPQMPPSAVLSLEEAWHRVSPLETEIAVWIWEHPFDDYPPDNYQPKHADFLYRVELSRILSRVPGHDDRRELLHRFYRELEIDSHK